ncbi:MAG: hypothetical protein K9N23_01870 [Akkermansiaceae bacterium]|nr:hypothetical protein [Akkermansiaceae bacterium]MCF7730398.1 hypothetical protein [Akkermansiaceae bacterium]
MLISDLFGLDRETSLRAAPAAVRVRGHTEIFHLLRMEWDEKRHVLTGVSQIIGDHRYRVSLAPNGYSPTKIECKDKDKRITAHLSSPKERIIELSLEESENGTVERSVSFKPE